jgi:hypothetical protein
MNPEEFLKTLLQSQELTPEQEKTLQQHKAEVTDFLRAEFGSAPIIKYAGSWAKGTMVQEKYDLDIVCYFPSSDTRSLKEIRQDVSNHLQKRYTIEPKSSAERIKNPKGAATSNGYHIDVVPGRFIEGSKDVFLHVAYGDKERMQTNLKTHIDHIAGSGCVPIIRLVKIWAHRNHLSIKTFILELFVVRAMNGSRNKTNLTEGFREVLGAFRDEFGSVQLVDPANTNNVVSQTITSSDKTAVSGAALAGMQLIEDSDDIADWRAVFNEQGDDAGKDFRHTFPGPAVVSSPSQAFTPRAPWCDDYVERGR